MVSIDGGARYSPDDVKEITAAPHRSSGGQELGYSSSLANRVQPINPHDEP